MPKKGFQLSVHLWRAPGKESSPSFFSHSTHHYNLSNMANWYTVKPPLGEHGLNTLISLFMTRVASLLHTPEFCSKLRPYGLF